MLKMGRQDRYESLEREDVGIANEALRVFFSMI